MPKPGTSEFERKGVHKSGVYGGHTAAEKLTIIKRTEQDPEGLVDLDATPDKFEHGGVESIEGMKIR